jgi:hypothetical protein
VRMGEAGELTSQTYSRSPQAPSRQFQEPVYAWSSCTQRSEVKRVATVPCPTTEKPPCKPRGSTVMSSVSARPAKRATIRAGPTA